VPKSIFLFTQEYPENQDTNYKALNRQNFVKILSGINQMLKRGLR